MIDRFGRKIVAEMSHVDCLWSERPEWLAVPAASGAGDLNPVLDSDALLRLACFFKGRDPGAVLDYLDRTFVADALRIMGIVYGNASGRDDSGRLDIEVSDPSPVGCLQQTSPGEEPFAVRSAPLSKHALDVALSRGRHAVERAKLAGSALLIGVAWSRETRIDVQSLRAMEGDPYRRLALQADPEIAALVGAAISAGQIGLPMICFGRGGAAAMSVVRRLHPGVMRWVVPCPSRQMVAQASDGRRFAPAISRVGDQSGSEDLQAIAAVGCSC